MALSSARRSLAISGSPAPDFLAIASSTMSRGDDGPAQRKRSEPKTSRVSLRKAQRSSQQSWAEAIVSTEPVRGFNPAAAAAKASSQDRGLEASGFPDQRPGQPVRVVEDFGQDESALDAGLSPVGASFAGTRSDQAAALQAGFQKAALAAERADERRPCPRPAVANAPLEERPRGADIDASPAEAAARLEQSPVKRRPHGWCGRPGRRRSARMRPARPGRPVRKARTGCKGPGRGRSRDRRGGARPSGKPPGRQMASRPTSATTSCSRQRASWGQRTQPVGSAVLRIPSLGSRQSFAFGADQAGRRVLREDESQDAPAQGAQRRRVRGHPHAFLQARGAGGDGLAASHDLDQADAAGRGGRYARDDRRAWGWRGPACGPLPGWRRVPSTRSYGRR